MSDETDQLDECDAEDADRDFSRSNNFLSARAESDPPHNATTCNLKGFAAPQLKLGTGVVSAHPSPAARTSTRPGSQTIAPAARGSCRMHLLTCHVASRMMNTQRQSVRAAHLQLQLQLVRAIPIHLDLRIGHKMPRSTSLVCNSLRFDLDLAVEREVDVSHTRTR
jgi:hypothetical protein